MFIKTNPTQLEMRAGNKKTKLIRSPGKAVASCPCPCPSETSKGYCLHYALGCALLAGNRWCLKKRMDRAKNSVRPRRWRPRARQQVRPLERGLKKSRSHLQRRGGGDRLLGNCEGGEFGKALPREYARGDMCHLVRRGVRGR